MRDPGLVQRAERAAIALERAWGRWRNQHVLGEQPPTPVSSYVGYSLEEPWGQPRVVFGVGADEAEMLAALLDGHDCVGPVYAEITDWRRSASNQPATPVSADYRLPVPIQAPSLPEQLRSPVDSADRESAGREPADRGPAERESVDKEPAEDEPVQQDRVQLEVIAQDASAVESALPDDDSLESIPLDDESIPLDDLSPLPPNESTGAFDSTPSQGPGYCGPRYQGVPPRYQAESNGRFDAYAGRFDADDVSFDDGPAFGYDEADMPADGKLSRAATQVISRLSRSRRSPRGTHEAGSWMHEQERQEAADTTV
jgi:hypothetical protein